MANNASKGFPHSTGFVSGGFPSASGFPASSGFPSSLGFPPKQVFPNAFTDSSEKDNKGADVAKMGTAPKNVKFFEGTAKLNKTETTYAWKEFGGDNAAVFEADGSAYITRIIEREAKTKNGIYFKLTEKLMREADGYGVISWRLDLGAVVKRKPAKQKFDENWKDAILAKVREVVESADAGTSLSISAASRSLSDELGASFSTMRANLWVAERWSRGETSTFLPHRTMIRPIFDLLCELGKKEMALASLSAYCTDTARPSKYVLEVLNEYRT